MSRIEFGLSQPIPKSIHIIDRQHIEALVVSVFKQSAIDHGYSDPRVDHIYKSETLYPSSYKNEQGNEELVSYVLYTALGTVEKSGR